MTRQWNHHTTTVNNIRIHYVLQGQGFPVVLLHGWPETWFSWRKQIPVLAERFEVIVPDLRGFGDSDKPLSGYDTRTLASDIHELVEALGHRRVALVGHDIGARVAYRWCLDYEEEIDRVALLGGPHPLELLGPLPPSVVREVWHAFFHQVPDLPEHLVTGNLEVYLRHFYRSWSSSTTLLTDEEVAEYVRAYSQPGALRASFSYYRAIALNDPPHWRADADRQLSLPLLYLWGDHRKRIASLADIEAFEPWRRVFPNARGRYVESAGHFLHEERPEEVNGELLAFLSRAVQ